MIIQGDNKPIILEMSESVANIEYFSAVLYDDKTVYKSWDLDDVECEGVVITLPLLQSETMLIGGQFVNLEVKFVANESIEFVDEMKIYVKKRKDNTIFPIGGEQVED